jgi:hypothetical protein
MLRLQGLHKLQLIREAKQKCPDVIIVLGEDLTRFRNASRDLYNFLRARIWNSKAERLGFDEVSPPNILRCWCITTPRVDATCYFGSRYEYFHDHVDERRSGSTASTGWGIMERFDPDLRSHHAHSFRK